MSSTGAPPTPGALTRLPGLSTSSQIFFFSSRRRHTRSLSDWSSDVCSSDLQTLFPKVILQKFLHLTAAFADQANHRDIGVDIARQHRQQYRLADAGAGKDAEPLAAAAGQEGIERPHPEIERRADALARMRRRRRIAIGYRRGPLRQRDRKSVV